ncbi:hypothetical protein [Streptomyces sp. NBC_01361]|uniref:hypothetical protein n=1 Tax=Streptomyces sp. NBC_01361 TaxID=2903838 RepID=UPI002E30BDA2|nr:hypothetical protein [Streptomyces sp. NBC_01361]
MPHALAVLLTRWRVLRAAKRLGLRPDRGFRELKARIEELRGKPIVIKYGPLQDGATGLTYFGTAEDTILVTSAADPLHRIIITLHELWHLIEDLVGPGRAVRLWRSCIMRPLERLGLRQPQNAPSVFGDHSVLDLDHLSGQLSALPPEVVRAVLDSVEPVRMRGDHNNGADPADTFAREMVQRLYLGGNDNDDDGSITSSFVGRRTGI